MKYTCPISVTLTTRVLRFNRVVPKLFSRSAMRLDREEGGTENASAARVKLPVSTTLLKYLSALS